jgi:uncharacterized protein YbjT (DUF2867 family)
MKVLVFGATGMVGQGVLLECLRDPEVELAVTIGRTATGLQNPKLKEILHQDLSNYSAIADQLTGFNACFFCLGVSSARMTEADYRRITYQFTLAAAEELSRVNPGMTFIYVSGAGTDSSEHGSSMWARVKGQTENALLRLPLSGYMFRPGLIVPLDGIRSKTRAYRILYSLLGPFLMLLSGMFPKAVVTTREIGQAMLSVAKRGYAKDGYAKRVLEAADIRAILSA